MITRDTITNIKNEIGRSCNSPQVRQLESLRKLRKIRHLDLVDGRRREPEEDCGVVVPVATLSCVLDDAVVLRGHVEPESLRCRLNRTDGCDHVALGFVAGLPLALDGQVERGDFRLLLQLCRAADRDLRPVGRISDCLCLPLRARHATENTQRCQHNTRLPHLTRSWFYGAVYDFQLNPILYLNLVKP